MGGPESRGESGHRPHPVRPTDRNPANASSATTDNPTAALPGCDDRPRTPRASPRTPAIGAPNTAANAAHDRQNSTDPHRLATAAIAIPAAASPRTPETEGPAGRETPSSADTGDAPGDWVTCPS